MVAAAVLLVGFAFFASGCHLPFIRDGYDQAYRASPDNWLFRRRFPEVDHLFNGFDYGHAIVYERLLQSADAPQRLDGPDFRYITTDLLMHPPAVPLVERAIGPHYATQVPEVVAMFEWAHMLHRDLYDILADRQIDAGERDRRVAAALRYYGSRRDLALSRVPKSMDLMEGQPYSLVFRREAPKFNGLLWSYHWLQMALYDALLDAKAPAEQTANVHYVVERFWALVERLPSGPPTVMPMSAAIAPEFSALYPQASIIFDNLHSLHDVVADILASPTIPRGSKRTAILAAAAVYRDTTTATTTVAVWAEMATMMGIDAMGGPALAARRGRLP